LSSSERFESSRGDDDASLRLVLLSCGWRASRSPALRPCASLVRRSRLVVRPPCGLGHAGPSPCKRFGKPPSGLRPAPEYHPSDPRTVLRLAAPPDAAALSRFLSPTAQPIRRDPPLPGMPLPGHVTPSHLPRASASSSLDGLPDLSIGRAHGVHPSELHLAGIAVTSRPGLPSCDSRDDFHRRASLQGFTPPAGWDCCRRISPRHGSPGSPGFRPPWGFLHPQPRTLPIHERPVPFRFPGPAQLPVGPQSSSTCVVVSGG